MKRIGIVGGLSAESSTHFYSALTRLYVERFDRADYPEIVMFSVRFQTLMDMVARGDWDAFAAAVVEGVRALEAAGAEFAVIAANLPHVVFDRVKAQVSIPMLHIADVVSDVANARGMRHVALLGTLPTMQADFYPTRLGVRGITCEVPEESEQSELQSILDTELFRGVVTEASEKSLVRMIERCRDRGCDGVILGCTEIPMLIGEHNSVLPVLDTTALFVEATLAYALQDD